MGWDYLSIPKLQRRLFLIWQYHPLKSRSHMNTGSDIYRQSACSCRFSLRWRHNERDGVSNQPASRLFTQPFIQARIKENIKVPRHWPLWGESLATSESPAQRESHAENVSIWWHHHVKYLKGCKIINRFSVGCKVTNVFNQICMVIHDFKWPLWPDKNSRGM